MLKNPKTEAKSETKRPFSMSGQREALPDSGSHYLFNTLLGGFEKRLTEAKSATKRLLIGSGDSVEYCFSAPS